MTPQSARERAEAIADNISTAVYEASIGICRHRGKCPGIPEDERADVILALAQEIALAAIGEEPKYPEVFGDGWGQWDDGEIVGRRNQHDEQIARLSKLINKGETE